MRLTVHLNPPEAEQLLRLADRERRHASDQAAVLIALGLRRLARRDDLARSDTQHDLPQMGVGDDD